MQLNLTQEEINLIDAALVDRICDLRSDATEATRISYPKYYEFAASELSKVEMLRDRLVSK